MLTLNAAYVRRVAQSYRLLQDANTPCGAKELRVIQQAARRCLQAAARSQLVLTPDVPLGLTTVRHMLREVDARATARLPVRPPNAWHRLKAFMAAR